MSEQPTNADIYGVLLGLKEDIGGLKTSTSLQLEAIKNHSGRITVLEGAVQRQKGFAKAITLVGMAGGTAVGWLIERFGIGHH